LAAHLMFVAGNGGSWSESFWRSGAGVDGSF
jgi:hypothetical protein